MIHSENSSKHQEKINPVNNFDDDINELEKNIYGDLIQNQIINELELLDPKEKTETPKIISETETMSFEEWLTGNSTVNHNQTDIDSIIKNLNERKILKKKESFLLWI